MSVFYNSHTTRVIHTDLKSIHTAVCAVFSGRAFWSSSETLSSTAVNSISPAQPQSTDMKAISLNQYSWFNSLFVRADHDVM